MADLIKIPVPEFGEHDQRRGYKVTSTFDMLRQQCPEIFSDKKDPPYWEEHPIMREKMHLSAMGYQLGQKVLGSRYVEGYWSMAPIMGNEIYGIYIFLSKESMLDFVRKRASSSSQPMVFRDPEGMLHRICFEVSVEPVTKEVHAWLTQNMNSPESLLSMPKKQE